MPLTAGVDGAGDHGARIGIRNSPFRAALLPKPSFILGIRKYHSSVTEFKHGTRLAVSVRESTRDDAGGAVFDSTLSLHAPRSRPGCLTVYEPDNIVQALADQFV